MSNVWKTIEALMSDKRMVRFSHHPGGHIALGVYIGEDQYLYELQDKLIKDFSPVVQSTLPRPPGFPKP